MRAWREARRGGGAGHVQDPNHSAHHDFKLKTKQVVRLGTDQLVPALNEQLQERRKGNDFYKARKFNAALKHYNNGLSICNFVVRAPLVVD
jgi:hypothetical protein